MGTSVVQEGDFEAPAVLVLDPAEEWHQELPEAWRRLTSERQVVWCRLATPDAFPEAERMLADPDALGRPIDVVTRGPVRPDVRDLLSRRPGPVRSLLLVDPDEEEGEGAIGGVPVRVAARGQRSRSLAERDVADAVRTAIAEIDAEATRPHP
ncbi:hypothetical protein B0I33_108102 [Prauserella shujinwangii]|uniref:Uncharacterized protein n=1 Tax=Prauserella shujinwangii TaxID=1453103 RepID=A0A2T0LR91_9PSEU|nr:hypothetical protein [Prauserella shujinwangii]PRX45955.1 hypothetical protein B0I33_108102 [Prauserella shujinwangii]